MRRLAPGDIIRDPLLDNIRGMVMRNTPSELIVAIPGMTEFCIYIHASAEFKQLKLIGNINDMKITTL